MALEAQENKKYKTNGELLYDSGKYAEWLLNHILEEGKYNVDVLTDKECRLAEDFIAEYIQELLEGILYKTEGRVDN